LYKEWTIKDILNNTVSQSGKWNECPRSLLLFTTTIRGEANDAESGLGYCMMNV